MELYCTKCNVNVPYQSDELCTPCAKMISLGEVLDERKQLRALLDSLLNKVNRVTARYRRGRWATNDEDLNALVDRQLEVEAKLQELE